MKMKLLAEIFKDELRPYILAKKLGKEDLEEE